jgi:RNA polymerase sigma-70 factor (ECF subfamily)
MDARRADSLEEYSDGELVRLLVHGNQDALGVIFDRYYRLVMSVALRILHDSAEAEDVVQNVFIAFYERSELFDESKGNLRTWLLQYAYGRSFNQKRKLRLRHFHQQVEFESAEAELRKENVERVFDLDTSESARLVEQILPRLNEKQRSVVELVFFEGLKLSEIARKTGDSLGNVHHAYYRGIEKLRSYLAEPREEASGQPSLLEQRFSWLRKASDAAQRLREEV